MRTPLAWSLICLGGPLCLPAAGAAAAEASIEWVQIPGGKFIMGSADADALPAHPVSIKPFEMAKSEVTFAQYEACVQAGACSPVSESCASSAFRGKDQPVVCVSWKQAGDFSRWAGGRLPSEAEWEYAARSAGKDWKYPWGKEAPTCERAVMYEKGYGCGREATWPVCSKPKGNTQQGLCDMAGNVWEWVEDWHHPSYRGAPKDGGAWVSPAGAYRVIRGGSWFNGFVKHLPAAARFGYVPDYGFPGAGFRPVRDMKASKARP